MLNKVMKKYALSKQGAIDFIKACIACILVDLSLMMPVGLLYYLVEDLLNGNDLSIIGYVLKTIACLGFIVISNYVKYNLTFFTTYKESGVRRITLAETLRKIAILLSPFMPEKSNEILNQLNISSENKSWDLVYSDNEISENTRVIEKGEPLFARLDRDEEIEYIKSNMK